ncbi:MAG: SoxR reducing system RseC family protein [Hydrogenophilaceae bacterium]|nr:SoxR reducing system RseC family protein [Hydrogenophilaceae bacterium]
MLEQNAVVLKVEGGRAWVEARESGTCGSCGSGGCSTRRLADLFGQHERTFPVENVLHARSGDKVIIGIPEGALWRSAFRLYGLPLMLMLMGALFGQYVAGDMAAAAMAMGGLMASSLLQRVWRDTFGWKPVMLQSVDRSGLVVGYSS